MTVLDSNNNEYTVSDNVLTIVPGTSGTGVMPAFSSSSTVRDLVGTNFTSVVIGSGMTNVSDYSFDECGSITSITISNSVTSIGDYAFDYCDSLTSIAIPNNIVTIGDYAFFACSDAVSLSIGAGVTSIGEYAFSSCHITSLTIPDNVTSIGEGAFANSTLLETLTIGSGLSTISDMAFMVCYNLLSVYISSGVTTIGNEAFEGCTSLTSVTVLGTTPATLSGSEQFPNNPTKIYVPKASNSTYLSSWSTYSSQIYSKINTPVAASSSYVYDGNSHSCITSYSDISYTDTSNITKIYVGTYVGSVTPKTHFLWSDGTATSKTYNWSITAKQLTISGTSVSGKVYDGSSSANVTIGTLSGVISGDTVSPSASGTFSDANVGVNKNVTVTYSLSGSSAYNYIAPVNDTLTASITVKEATLGWTAPADLTYNKTAKVPSVAVSNLVSGDTCTVTCAVTSGKDNVNAGTFTFTATALSNGNYKLPASAISPSYTIAQKEATLGWTAPSDLVYNKAAKTPACNVTNLISGDTCTVTSAVTSGNDNVNVGSFTFTASALSNGNYKLPINVISSTYVITKRSLTPSLDISNVSARTYDGTANVSGALISLSGAAGSENPTASATVLMASVNAGNRVVNAVGISLDGTWGTNYSLSATADTNIASFDLITKTSLVPSIDLSGVVSRQYDSTTNVYGAAIILSGAVGSESPTATAVFAMASKDAGNQIVNASDIALTSSWATNYELSATTASADKGSSLITAVQLTISGTTVSGKTYDGTATAAITIGTLSGVITGDIVSVSESGSFPDANAGTKSVTVSYTISGVSASNYLAPVNDILTAVISQKAFTDEMFALGANPDYTGSAITVPYTITDGSPSIITSDDYDITGITGTNIGTYTATVTAKRNYTGSVSEQWQILSPTVLYSISCTNATSDPESGTYQAQQPSFNITFSADTGCVLRVPTVTIAGEAYTGSTWSSNILSIPTNDIIGAVTVNEVAIDDAFDVAIDYNNTIRKLTIPDTQEIVIGTEGDSEATTLSLGVTGNSLPENCTLSIMFDVHALNDHVVSIKYVDLTYNSTTGKYTGVVPAEVFNNTLDRKLPVQLRVTWDTTSGSVTTHRRFYSLNTLTFIVAKAVDV